MTCKTKTGQMSVRVQCVSIFKTLRLRYRWADVDEVWHVYSMGRGYGIVGFNVPLGAL